ncbi:MAG TPA: DUF6580 family putative transport protein [Candidatus Humimicrobiaceae bacterium]|nr:DUF6580 family putative transport protein [Candidatus Humimicrobiaceae bacterium]
MGIFQAPTKKKILFAIFVILFGVVLQIFLNKVVGIPNLEAVTAISLLSSSFLGGFFAPLIPLLIIFLSDFYFGNVSVYFFTWSVFVLIGIFGIFFKRDSRHYFLKISGGGILSVLFFYLWTNFGWWLTFGMYPMNFQGLITSYIAGLPFLKNQLASVLIFTPAFSLFFSFIFDKLFIKKKKTYENFAFVSKIS